MSKKMNPVVHFEMPAEDRKRMSDFYTNVFGWRMRWQREVDKLLEICALILK